MLLELSALLLVVVPIGVVILVITVVAPVEVVHEVVEGIGDRVVGIASTRTNVKARKGTAIKLKQCI